MIWDHVRRTFEDYFSRQEFSYDIIHGEDPEDTECSAVLKIDEGPREQRMTLVLESEENINYLRVLTPVVPVEKCSKEQLIRLMEQNIHWVGISVGVLNKQVMFTSLLPLREFEADPAALGDSMRRVARRADQMETLLFGSDH